MPGLRSLARVFAAGMLFAMAGCVRWTHLPPSSLEIHGKAGQVCSAAVTPLVWSVNTALFPVSVASLGQTPPSHDNLGYPGLAVENSAYFVCATLGLPLYALDRGIERAFFVLADHEAVEEHLIERLPELSREDYELLVRTSGRTWPPPYELPEVKVPLSSPGAGSSREFGYWSTAQAPRYGSKPRLGNPLAAAEWRDWRAAGRPRDTDAETAFVVNRALGFSDPSLQFAATYGPAQQSRFEKEFASQQARAAICTDTATEPDVTAALRDPSPLLRAAAVRLRARTPDGALSGALVRHLEDRAVMVRVAAADALGSLTDPGSVAALGRALNDADQRVRERAALALGRIGTEEAADRLLPSLGNLGHRARFQALCALAAAGRPGVRDALSRALADQDVHTRIAAAAAIGRTAADPGDPLYIRTQNDPDSRISESAANARERRDKPGASR